MVAATEPLFRAIFNQAAVGLGIASADGVILRVNDHLASLLGYRADELAGMTFRDVTHFADIESTTEALRDLFAGETESYVLEKRYLCRDGSHFWGRMTASLVRDDGGRPLHTLSVVENIDDRRRAEEALRESEARLRRATEAGRLATFEVDDPGTGERARVSANFHTLYGLAPETPIDFRTLLDRIHPDDRSAVTADHQRLAAVGGSFDAEFRVVLPDGSLRWIQARGQAEPGSNGMPRTIRGVNLDITERVENRQRLKKSEAESHLLRLLAQHSPDFIGVCDTGGTSLFVNEAGLSFVGMTREEARSTTVSDYFIEKERDHVRDVVLPAVLRDGQWEGELHFHHAMTGEAIPVLYNVFRVDDPEFGEPSHLATVTRDLRASKRTEEAQRMLIDELNHRVRNTLAIVSSIASQTIRHSPSFDAFGEAFEGRIQALAATHTLLADLKWEDTTLDAVIESQLRPYRQPPHSVSAEGPAIALKPKSALALSLVFHELATNAVKYGALAHAAGSIDISWSLIGRGRNRTAELRWKEQGGPLIERPSTAGFGSKLISANIEHEFGGKVRREYRSDGLVLFLTMALPEHASA